jgi:CRP-like cAMP-binding protein
MTGIGQQALERFLEKVTERSVLTTAEQQAILDLPMRPATYGARNDIVQLGQVTSHSCLIADGIAARFAETAGGDRQIIALHIAGDMADLHSVVSPQVVTPLQALSSVLLYQIPHAALSRIATEYPALAHAFWRDAVIDAAIVSQTVLNLGRRRGPARIAHVLCELAYRHNPGEARREFSFSFPVSQPQLGDIVGLHPVHINRTLRQLRAERLLELDGRTAHILDWDGLVALAEFDPVYLQFKAIDFHRATSP